MSAGTDFGMHSEQELTGGNSFAPPEDISQSCASQKTRNKSKK
jgi:hypothetical protein